MSLISESWIRWLNKNKFPTPTGSSGKIPDISVIIMLLEWWKRQRKFVFEVIFKDADFINFCNCKKLTINQETGIIRDSESRLYKLAKISVSPDNQARHLQTWKIFSFYNDTFTDVVETIKSLVIDITFLKRNIRKKNINNLQNWLKDNWLEEFNSIKHYFV